MIERAATLTAEGRPVGARRWGWLAAEFAAVFFGLVGFYALIGSPGSPIPLLVVLGAGALFYLRGQSSFDRANLWRPAAVRPVLPGMLATWAAVAVLMVAAIALIDPGRLFSLPRENPLIWILVAVFYPLFSVYPQELLFRGFLMHRYAPVFGTGWKILLASAVAFGFAHIIYGTVISVVLTLVAGWMFARRYRQTRSLLAASIEHAFYGVLAFTVGLGDLFYHGAVS